LWSSAFEQHIQERHGLNRPAKDAETCETIRVVM
jgi:hypothetical protein